ncbi:MAG: SDR family oxidoreductase [Myxococcota bacterium]|jgi:pteridine reductase
MGLALVTGGAIRVGRAITLALAGAGFDVVIHANRSRDAAQALEGEVRALGRQAWVEAADLSVYAEVAGLAERVKAAHPRLDVLVNSAAAYEHLDFEAVTPAHLERMLAVNVRAPFFLTQGLLPALRAAKGAVINITDMAVSHAYTPTHFFAHYLASKAALEQLTRAWALELGPDVRVNAVAPGPVAIAQETTEAQRADLLARLPLKREGRPEDVAAAVAFLARAPYITGQTLRVDGGLSVA